MIFYNGFNLLVDILVAVVACRLAYGFGFKAGYTERDGEITDYAEQWADHYYEMQREMRD